MLDVGTLQNVRHIIRKQIENKLSESLKVKDNVRLGIKKNKKNNILIDLIMD